MVGKKRNFRAGMDVEIEAHSQLFYNDNELSVV
jgi:hypothetical protein